MDKIEKQFFILHEGPIGVFDNSLHEVKFSKLIKKGTENFTSSNGWAGISDKYWFTAIIPDKNQNFNYRYTAYQKNNLNKFQVDMQSEDLVVKAGSSYQSENLLLLVQKKYH